MKTKNRIAAIAAAAAMVCCTATPVSAAVNDSDGAVIGSIRYRQDGTYSLLGYLPEDAHLDYMVADKCMDADVTELTLPSYLDGVILGESAVMPVKRIQEGAFMELNDLVKVTLPETMEHLDRLSFYKCYALEEINLPDSINFIGEYAFAYAKLKNVTLPANLETVELYAFGACSELESFDIPANALNFTVKDGVLYNKDMTKLVLYPTASAVTEFTVPDTVETLAQGSFLFANNVQSIVLPDSVTVIETWAVQSCDALTSVTIPRSVTYFGENAFGKCGNLTIYGYADSEAENYANNNGIPFVALEETATTTTEPSQPLKGDYNGDGAVEIADAVLLARYIGEDTALTAEQINSILNAEPDYSSDQRVTILDVRALLKELEEE